MLSLPLELLELIGFRLDPSDVGSLSLVSKKLYTSLTTRRYIKRYNNVNNTLIPFVRGRVTRCSDGVFRDASGKVRVQKTPSFILVTNPTITVTVTKMSTHVCLNRHPADVTIGSDGLMRFIGDVSPTHRYHLRKEVRKFARGKNVRDLIVSSL